VGLRLRSQGKPEAKNILCGDGQEVSEVREVFSWRYRRQQGPRGQQRQKTSWLAEVDGRWQEIDPITITPTGGITHLSGRVGKKDRKRASSSKDVEEVKRQCTESIKSASQDANKRVQAAEDEARRMKERCLQAVAESKLPRLLDYSAADYGKLYRPIRELAEPGNGCNNMVREMWSTAYNTVVAVKEMSVMNMRTNAVDMDLISEARREFATAELAYSAAPSGVVKHLEIFRVEGPVPKVCIAITKATCDLARWRGQCSLASVQYVVKHLATTLSNMHSRGVWWLDGKPQNILVIQSGARPQILIADFGLSAAHRFGHFGRIEPFGRNHGWFVGTEGYRAPEQVAEGEISGKSDVFALGVIAQELLQWSVTPCPSLTELLSKAQADTYSRPTMADVVAMDFVATAPTEAPVDFLDLF